MGDKKEKFNPRDLYTIPNILTYIRIILTVPFAYFFINKNFIAAAICVALSGLSDCFDGLIARRFNQVTALGKILDPIADKITLFVVVVCMVLYVPIVLPVLVILLLKDLLMMFGGMYMLRKGLTPPAAKWYGKVGTIMFYFSVCLIVFFEAVLPQLELEWLYIVLLGATAVMMLFALYKYGMIFLKMLRQKKQEQNK